MQHHVFDNGAAAQTRMDHVARYRDGAKRWMDIAGVLALAPVAVPLVAMMWVLVRLGGGPGFYGQQRIGRGGAAIYLLENPHHGSGCAGKVTGVSIAESVGSAGMEPKL